MISPRSPPCLNAIFFCQWLTVAIFSYGQCVNEFGSFCCCPKGFYSALAPTDPPSFGVCTDPRVDSKSSCTVDIDECKEQKSDCDNVRLCVNTYGSYCCCPSGFTANRSLHIPLKSRTCDLASPNSSCVDVDECKMGTDNCRFGQCLNIWGGFCCCPTGFLPNSTGMPLTNVSCEIGNGCYPIDYCSGPLRCEGRPCRKFYFLGDDPCGPCFEGYIPISDFVCILPLPSNSSSLDIPLVVGISGALTLILISASIIGVWWLRKSSLIKSLPLELQYHFSHQRIEQEASQWKTQNSFKFQEIYQNSNHWERFATLWNNYLDGSTVPVDKVYAIINQNLVSNFIGMRNVMKTRFEKNPKAFMSKRWKLNDPDHLRRKTYRHYNQIVDDLIWTSGDPVPIVPFVHGTSEQVAWQICDTGTLPSSSLQLFLP